MKKIFLIATFMIAITFHGFSQVHFGIQAGGNVAITQIEVNEDDDLSNKARFGVVAGVIADIPLGPLSFRPEINFIQKGYKNEEIQTGGGFTSTFTNKARLNYVEVPLNFVYNIHVGSGKVYLGLGPNFGLGMGGNVKSTGVVSVGGLSQTETETQDVRFDGKENDGNDNKYHLKRLDFGGNVLAGFQTGMGLFVNLGFTLGLSDISPNSSDNNNFSFTQKNHGVHLKLGYMFGCKTDKSKSTTNSSGM